MSKLDQKVYVKDGKMMVPWRISETDIVINLLTPEEYKDVPLGTELFSIFGHKRVKSEDSDNPTSENYIDQDTRFGRIAFGIEDKE